MATMCDGCGKTCGKFSVEVRSTGLAPDGRINAGHVHFHTQPGTAPGQVTVSCFDVAIGRLLAPHDEHRPQWKSGELRDSEPRAADLEAIPTLRGPLDGPASAKLGVDIGELEISTRAYNALRRAGLLTCDAVVERVREDTLRSVPGVGYRSFREIVDALRKLGYDPIPSPSPSPG